MKKIILTSYLRHVPQREPAHSDTREYIQQYDDKQFSSSKALERRNKEVHIEVRFYKCETCHKSFKGKFDLQIHESIHRGEKPYQCELCKRVFTRKGTLDQHKKHCNGQNYKCMACEKGFNAQQDLRHHVNTDHPRERKYKCNQCPSTFIYRQNLNAHINTHKGKKPHLCEVCGRAFSLKHNKDRHRSSVHSDKKPFECLVSGKCYKEKDSLHEHMRIESHTSDTIVENQPTDNRIDGLAQL